MFFTAGYETEPQEIPEDAPPADHYIVVQSDGLIANKIRLNDPSDYEVEAGMTIHRDEADTMLIGGSFVDGVYTSPFIDEAPPTVPRVQPIVSKLGLKRALDELGLWADVKAAIASNPAVQEEWDLAVEIHRNDPMTQFVINLLQYTEQQVDALIVRAHELVRPAPAGP